MGKLKSWLMELRAPFLTVTIIPVILGALVAKSHFGAINYPFLALALLGAVFIHLGTNIINDYFDYKKGTDNINVEFIRPFSGGSRMVQNKLLSEKEVLAGAIIFFILGLLIGIYLAFKVGIIVFYLGIFGILSAILYSAFLSSYFVGEALVGFNFGIIMALGSYYVQAKTINFDVVWISLPLALLTSLILWVNEFPDCKADRESGKKTMVVRLGRKNASLIYSVFLIFIFIYIIGLSLLENNFLLLLSLITLPLALVSIFKILKYYNEPKKMFACYPLTIIMHLAIGVVLILAFL
ncbi:prenyltransferase [Candidatus Woesearchaeota archaeon]|nr:prenyltransferase [Candidatus Woesearchaeota archaeon]